MKFRIGAATLAALVLFVSTWESGPDMHLKAYKDIVGVWTICDGITKGVGPTTTATPAECKSHLIKELHVAYAYVDKCLPGPRSPGEDLAYTSLVYNVGSGAVCNNTGLRRKYLVGDRKGACDELLRWRYAGGKSVPGLLNRRKAEHIHCVSGKLP